MIYDKVQHCDLVYSENQEVGRYNSDFTREYMLRRSEQVREANNGKPVVMVNNLKEFGIGALGLIISLIIAFVLARVLPCGRHLVFHMGAAFLCGYIGLMKIRSNKSYDKFSYTKDKLAETIAGVLLIVEAIAILVMWFNLPFATDWECSFFMAGIFLLVMAAYKAVRLVLFLTRSIRIYTREIEAECIGYVRLRTESTDSDSHTHILWYHSPVFKYMIDGQQMIAFYDTLAAGIDSKIARGPVTIRVNKDNPGSIMNPSLRGTFSSIILIAVFLLIGAFFVYGVLHGGVHGSSIGI